MLSKYSLNPDWTEEDVRRWLLTWFSGGVCELPGLPSQVAQPVAVQAIFDAEQPERREVIKRGTVLALQDWRARAHGFEAVSNLARVAALLRASSAVGVLGSIIEREFDQDWSDAQSKALSAVIATLHGFAPALGVEPALRRAFYHHRCDPRLSAQLFIGLARCNPDDYPLHAARFLALRERVASRFMHIGPALLRAITPATLIERFSSLSTDEQHAFVDLLSNTQSSALNITVSQKGVRLVWAPQPKWQVLLAPHPTAPTVPYAQQYQRLMESLPQANINDVVRHMVASGH